jgi:hypothetical protein
MKVHLSNAVYGIVYYAACPAAMLLAATVITNPAAAWEEL